MIKIIKNLMLVMAILGAVQVQAANLKPLDDTEMQAVNGQNAIQLSLKLHNNVDISRDNNHVAGAHCTPDSNGYSPCRLGMEFVDKERNWLVMKQFYGYMNLTDIRLEGVSLPTSNTLIPGSTTGETYWDPDRFRRETKADGSPGDCMIINCNPADANLAAIEMSYPSGKGAGVYEDMRTFLNVGKMTVEVNNPTATYSDDANPDTPELVADFGFMRDQTQGVANAFRISDSTGPNANMQVRFDGRTLIYGF